jgi:hypothetical protein
MAVTKKDQEVMLAALHALTTEERLPFGRGLNEHSRRELAKLLEDKRYERDQLTRGSLQWQHASEDVELIITVLFAKRQIDPLEALDAAGAEEER